MKMTIEIESLDDLINLIGLVRVMQDKKPAEPEAKNLIDKPLAIRAKEFLQKKQEELTAEKNKRREQFLDSPIAVLKLWPPAEEALKARGLWLVRHLYEQIASDLREIKNVGQLTIKQIRHEMASAGIDWYRGRI